jgi:hypothetical protein
VLWALIGLHPERWRIFERTRCGSKSSRLSHPSGAAAAIVLLVPPDLLSTFGFHRLAVRLEGLKRRLAAAKTFGGDPTLLETMTHHDAAKQFNHPCSCLLAFPNAPLERSPKDEGTAEEADGILEVWNRQAERASQPITPLKPLQTGRLLALIAGSHEAAGAASAGRQSVTGLMVHTIVGGWSQMSLEF